MYACIYCQGRLDRNWNGLIEPLSEQKVECMGEWVSRYPCYDYKSACCAKLNGIDHKLFYHANLIFWKVIRRGIADFVWRSP